MSEVTKTFKYSKSGKLGSAIVLALVILVTVAFSVYNHFLMNDINDLNTQIKTHKTKIENLNAQKDVHVFSLIKKHK